MDARDIPFVDEFDLIGAFDVLEHIEDDKGVLNEMYRAVKPGGGIVITVPQHPWLWSTVDDYSRHMRRYSADELKKKVTAAGFAVKRVTSFVLTLLPVMLLARRRYGKKGFDPTAELSIPTWQNELLALALTIEQSSIRLGLNLPIGGSLLLVAYSTKRGAAAAAECDRSTQTIYVGQ